MPGGGENEGKVATVLVRSFSCPGDAFWRAWLRSGLWLQRIRSDPIRAWAIGFAPCLALPSPAQPSWGSRDLPKTLPRPEHAVGAEIREAPWPGVRLIVTARSRASAPCGPSEPRPDSAGVWAPASLLAAWWMGSLRVGVPCQPLHREAGPRPAPQVSRPCTCRLIPRAGLCA